MGVGPGLGFWLAVGAGGGGASRIPCPAPLPSSHYRYPFSRTPFTPCITPPARSSPLWPASQYNPAQPSSDQNTWEGMVRSPNGANCVQKYSTLIEPFYAIEGCATLVRSALGVATVKADCPSTATGQNCCMGRLRQQL
eukprot:XP_001694946.1 predicted protein [Chlamydomonas reinhardtii]